MEAWQATTLVLMALLVGALLPAAVQLTLALRALRSTAAQADLALAAAAAAAVRLERLAARLEGGARVSAALGAAVGPAVAAAVRAWRAPGPEDGAGPASAGASTDVDPRRKEGST